MSDPFSSPLKRGAVESILGTQSVTIATRDAIRARLERRAGPPLVLDDEALTTLRAVCDRLIPQADSDRRVDLAARLDQSLAEGAGDGWRFDDLPTDGVVVALGMKGVDQSAQARFSSSFAALSPDRQDAVLAAVQDGSAIGEIWRALSSKRVFEELLGQLATLYYAHPYAQEAIGFIGIADAGGFHALGLNVRDPIEEAVSDALL